MKLKFTLGIFLFPPQPLISHQLQPLSFHTCPPGCPQTFPPFASHLTCSFLHTCLSLHQQPHIHLPGVCLSDSAFKFLNCKNEVSLIQLAQLHCLYLGLSSLLPALNCGIPDPLCTLTCMLILILSVYLGVFFFNGV